MWEICSLCGAVIADAHLHAIWHHSLEPVRDDPDPAEEPTHATD